MSSTHEVSGDDGDDLQVIDDIGPAIDELLNNAGIRTYAQLGGSSAEHLQTLSPVIDATRAQGWIDAARAIVESQDDDAGAI
jgi:predicted flap endonuclease-1-like 5' DNA nuclease